MEHPLFTLFLFVGCSVSVVVSSYTHYRLPTSLVPDHYQLKIITHLENPENFTFNGEVSILFKVLEDTSNITLHAKNLTIDESRIQLQSYDDVEFHLNREGIETVPEHDYYILRLNQTLLQGQKYKVNLHFSGILNEDYEGYFRSSYVDKVTKERRWLAVTDFQPTSARAAFPCFDEPNFKANFTIWLGHHQSLTAVSNMPLEKQIPMDEVDDFVWSIFEESIPMSTYLVAYTLNDFAYTESKVEGSDVVFRTWSTPDKIDQCRFAAEFAPQILQYYEDMFGIPYPFKKIDQMAIPDYRTVAMEHWGLVIYRDNALLFDANVRRPWDKQPIATNIAHELAHQWFGNLVTMKWWTDVWLNEGFATYIASLGKYHLSPEMDTYTADSYLYSRSIFRLEARFVSHPLSQPILNNNKILSNFNWVSYKKGAVVLRMMHMFLGHDAFFEAVRDYLTKYQYQNVEQDDLWAAFTEKAHKFNRIKPHQDMKTIMDSWTLQVGYPVVNVSRNYDTGSIEISQHRFFEGATTSGAKECWWVPLSYTTESEMDFVPTTPKAWLECDKSGKSVPLKLENVTKANDECIIFNIQVSGVYRVMYDINNWKLLQKTLNGINYKDIHVMNRAQIVDDVLTFAWNGYVDYGIAFDILEYLVKEREHLPWNSAFDGLAGVFVLLEYFPGHQAYLKAYLRRIIDPLYTHFGGTTDPMNASTAYSSVVLKFNTINWACKVDLADCVHTSQLYFRNWKLSYDPNSDNKIPSTLRDTVYCTAIRYGNADDGAFLWQRYKESEGDVEKTIIFKSLGCSRNATLLRDYIGFIVSKNPLISENDASFGIGSITAHDIGARVAREYFAEHFAELDDDYFFFSFEKVFSTIVSTDELNKLNKLIAFEDRHRFQSIFNTINFKMQWFERNLENMKSNLKEFHVVNVID